MKFKLTEAQKSAVRHALTFGGAYLVAHGKADAGVVEMIVGLALAFLGTGWGVGDEHQAEKAAKALKAQRDTIIGS